MLRLNTENANTLVPMQRITVQRFLPAGMGHVSTPNENTRQRHTHALMQRKRTAHLFSIVKTRQISMAEFTKRSSTSVPSRKNTAATECLATTPVLPVTQKWCTTDSGALVRSLMSTIAPTCSLNQVRQIDMPGQRTRKKSSRALSQSKRTVLQFFLARTVLAYTQTLST